MRRYPSHVGSSWCSRPLRYRFRIRCRACRCGITSSLISGGVIVSGGISSGRHCCAALGWEEIAVAIVVVVIVVVDLNTVTVPSRYTVSPSLTPHPWTTAPQWTTYSPHCHPPCSHNSHIRFTHPSINEIITWVSTTTPHLAMVLKKLDLST